MNLADYTACDGTALAALITTGEVSAAEVHDAAYRSITAVDPELNAVAGSVLAEPLHHDSAGPFAGVPFALKDLVCHAAGLEQESGSELCRGHVPDYDTDLMTRWRAAGLAVMCRTTTPEFGLSCSTESRISGITRNPFDTSRTPGGSSGGSAALVAAGALPWAHANDAAGSIRIPAALCGLVGLKPTRGRIAVGPDSDDPLFGLSTEFAITRTVRDSAALLDAVAGPALGDRYAVAAPDSSFAAALANPTGTLRVGFSTTAPFGGPVDTAHQRAVENTATELARMGHHVEEIPVNFDPDEFVEMSARFWSASIADTVATMVGGNGGPVATPSWMFTAGRNQGEVGHRLQATTHAFVAYGSTLRWRDISEARSWQNRLTRSVAHQFQRFDLHLTPTVARTAWPVGTPDPNRDHLRPVQWLHTLFELVPFTPLYNVTGQPAINLPAGSHDGLPVGVQLAAAPGCEALLLSIAAQFEQLRPWASVRPHLHVLESATSKEGV